MKNKNKKQYRTYQKQLLQLFSCTNCEPFAQFTMLNIHIYTYEYNIPTVFTHLGCRFCEGHWHVNLNTSPGDQWQNQYCVDSISHHLFSFLAIHVYILYIMFLWGNFRVAHSYCTSCFCGVISGLLIF